MNNFLLLEWYPIKGITATKIKEFHLKKWNPLKKFS